MAEVIPLFPLSHVLLPGMPLPLHIFEQRYRDLIDDVSADSAGAFGVVALRTGTEAVTPFVRDTSTPSTGTEPTGRTTGPDVEPIGTLAEILELERSPDGTSDLLSVGSRRFRIRRLITPGTRTTPETAYLRAEVDFLDECDGELTGEQQSRARELMDVYDAMLVRITGRGTGSELPDDAAQLSYQLAARLPLPPAEKQDLLADDTSAQRLVRLARLLRREIALLQRTRSIAVSPAVLRMVTGIN